MGLTAFDPDLLDGLRAAMRTASEALGGLACPDPAAAGPVTTVRGARLRLARTLLPRVDAIRCSPALFDYRPASTGARRFAATDPLPYVAPRSGVLGVEVPEGARLRTFPIPVWPGQGATRIQFFIDDEEVCLSKFGTEVTCGHGDDRSVATGAALSDYDLAARVRILLDHEAGMALVVAYPTHLSGRDVEALPIDLAVDPPLQYPPLYPSTVRTWTSGDGIDGNIVIDYRFLNSATPAPLGGLAPGINGAIRVRRCAAGTVEIDGHLAHYPTVEIIRDHPVAGGFHSAEIFVKPQDPGGPLNLYERGEPFTASG